MGLLEGSISTLVDPAWNWCTREVSKPCLRLPTDGGRLD
jgi:hypothetical protein